MEAAVSHCQRPIAGGKTGSLGCLEITSAGLAAEEGCLLSLASLSQSSFVTTLARLCNPVQHAVMSTSRVSVTHN